VKERLLSIKENLDASIKEYNAVSSSSRNNGRRKCEGNQIKEPEIILCILKITSLNSLQNSSLLPL
jgi:hypothetical protein